MAAVSAGASMSSRVMVLDSGFSTEAFTSSPSSRVDGSDKEEELFGVVGVGGLDGVVKLEAHAELLRVVALVP